MRTIVIRSLVALAAIATVALAQSSPNAQEPDPSATEIQALRGEISALRLELQRVAAESADALERTAKLESDLSAVAKEASTLAGVLDQSEEQGFTAGINFESRVTLLNGWRRYLDTVSSAGPKSESSASSRRR